MKIRTPNNFLFQIKSSNHNKIVHFYLLDKKEENKKIGRVSLYRQLNGIYETHSYLNKKYRGLGLGTKLYSKAIQWCLENGYSIRSSGSSSDEAMRVWQGRSIRKLFRIRKKKDKECPSFINDVWYAYSKIK